MAIEDSFGLSLPEPAGPATGLVAQMGQHGFVRVDTALTTNIPDNCLAGYFESVLVGDGACDLYCRQVVPDLAPVDAMPFAGDLTPRHLPYFNAATSPVVVLIGDSLATHQANSNQTIQGMLTWALRKSILNQAGSKTVAFHNRAIGGATWTDLDGVTARSPLPPWYSSGAASWLSYVEALNPDLVVIALGMNYTAGALSRIESVIAKIQAWTHDCDIVLATCLQPSPSTDDASWNTINAQAQRFAQAQLVRGVARRLGLGLLDFHRQHCIVRDGFDPCSGAIKYDAATANLSIDGYGAAYAPRYAEDFAFSITIAQADFPADGSSIVAVPFGNGSEESVQISRFSGGLDVWVFKGDSASGETPGVIKSKTGWSPNVVDGNYRIGVEVADNILTVRDLNDPLAQYSEWNEPAIFEKVVRRCIRFVPSVQTAGAARPVTAVRYDRGHYRINRPSARNAMLWGADATTQPFGGSGYNHPSSWASALIYAPVLGNAVWFG